MRFTVSPEQHKFFNIQGYLELSDLISSEEATQLLAAIRTLQTKIPGYTAENCFRSIPLIIDLARKRGWGHLASELLHKKPLRIAYDRFWSNSPQMDQTWEKESCGLLINLSSYQGTFFKESPAKINSLDAPSLFLIFTSKHLPEELNPIVIR